MTESYSTSFLNSLSQLNWILFSFFISILFVYYLNRSELKLIRELISNKKQLKENEIKVFTLRNIGRVIGVVFFLMVSISFFIGVINKYQRELELLIGRLNDYNRNITNVRVGFEGISEDHPDYQGLSYSEDRLLTHVQKTSKIIISNIKDIPDEKLNIQYKFFKYDNLTYIITIAAEVEQDSSKKNEFIIQGKGAYNLAKKFYEQIIENAKNKIEGEEITLKNWVVEGNALDRLKTFNTWLFALDKLQDNYLSSEDSILVRDKYLSISPEYRKNYEYLFLNNPTFMKYKLVANDI